MTATPGEALDEDRAEAFFRRMVGVLNDGSLAIQCSIGHRVGLFDAMAGLGPATSAGIAGTAGLEERYVREWLGAVTTGGVVEYDPSAGTYTLPPEHAAYLTRAAGPDNLARTLQFVTLLAGVEDRVVEAFREGGGVPYSAYPRFHQIMAEDSGAVFDATLLDVTLPLVDGLPARLEAGIDVADIGCGRGHAVTLMAQAYPRSRFVGYDFSEEAVAAACAEADATGLTNARFELRDVAALDVSGDFDLVTAFDAIHDQAQPARVLAGIAHALRPGGTFLMVDIKASSHLHENIGHPIGTFLYTASVMHCMTVSLALGGAGLGTVWGRQTAEAMLRDAGFADVEVKEVDADPLNYYYVSTRY